MTQIAAELIWFAGLVGWFVIRHPFARKAKKIGVSKSLFGHRESILLGLASLGLFLIPCLYTLTGIPASYTSFFLLGLAQMLLLPNWLAGPSGLIGVTILFIFRVRQEERMMLQTIGDEYRAYMATTKRLIPWVL